MDDTNNKSHIIIPSNYINAPKTANPNEIAYPQPQLYPDKLSLLNPTIQPNPQQLQINPEHYIHEQNYPQQPLPQQSIPQSINSGASYCPVEFDKLGTILAN